MMDYASILKAKEYDFIRKEERLGSRVILLGLGAIPMGRTTKTVVLISGA